MSLCYCINVFVLVEFPITRELSFSFLAVPLTIFMWLFLLVYLLLLYLFIFVETFVVCDVLVLLVTLCVHPEATGPPESFSLCLLFLLSAPCLCAVVVFPVLLLW